MAEICGGLFAMLIGFGLLAGIIDNMIRARNGTLPPPEPWKIDRYGRQYPERFTSYEHFMDEVHDGWKGGGRG